MRVDRDYLRKFVEDNNLTYKDLAVLSGVCERTLYSIRIGNNVSQSTVDKLCDYIGCEPSDIVKGYIDMGPLEDDDVC